MKKGKLRITEDGMLIYYCPGCKQNHGVYVDKKHAHNWNFDDNYEKPTFSPSILIRSGHYVPGYKSEDCWCNWNRDSWNNWYKRWGVETF